MKDRQEIETPEWMRKLFDREEEPRVVGEMITVHMSLLRVARAAKKALVRYPGHDTFNDLREALKEVEHLLE